MNNKTISYFLPIGVLMSLLCAHTYSDQPAISDPINSDSNKSGNDTITSKNVFQENSLKEFSKGDILIPDLKFGPANVSKRFPFSAENEGSSKPQKIKKKILISNLKSATEKAVLPNDKYDKQSYLRTLLNGSDPHDDEIKSKSSVKLENVLKNLTASTDEEVELAAEKMNATEEGNVHPSSNGTNTDDYSQNDTFKLESEKDLRFISNGPQNFEVSDRKKKNNSNFKISNRKSKVTTSTTENYGNKVTTNSYVYFTLQEVQKAVNNNYLNVNEDFEKNSQTLLVTSNTPVIRATEASPEGKPDSISNGNTVKNLVRLENNYYGPTDQTDWIPIMPIKRLESEKQMESHSTLSKNVDLNSNIVLTTTIKPVYPSLIQYTGTVIRKKHSTTESNVLVPSLPLSSSLPPNTGHQVHVAEGVSSTNEPSTTEQRIDSENDGSKFSFTNVDRTQISLNNTDPGMNRKVQNDTKQLGILNKFRGSAKYRPFVSGIAKPLNLSADNDTLNDNLTLGGNNTEDVLQKVEITSPSSVQKNSTVTQSSLPLRTSFTAAPKIESSDSLVFGKKLISNAINFGGMRAAPKIANETFTPLDISKPKNIAKIQVLKNTISDKFASDNPISLFKFSETEPPNSTTSTGEGSVPGHSVKYLSTTEIPDSAVNYYPIKLSSATSESSTAIEITTQPSFHEFPVDSSNLTYGSNEKVKDYHEIEFSTSRDILKISTPSARTIATSTPGEINLITLSSVGAETLATTTSGIDETPATEEESTTAFPVVTEMEKDALYTDEIMPKTTFKSSIHPENNAETESSFDDMSKQVNLMTIKTICVDVSMTTTEKDKNIFVDTEVNDNTALPTTTKTRSKDEESLAGSQTVRPGVHREITEENVPAYLKLTVEAASWEELCRLKDDLRKAIIHMLDGMNITSNSIVFLNLNDKSCQDKVEESKDDRSNLPMFLPVNMFLMNENGDFDKNLSEAFLNLWGQYGLDFELPIRKVDFLTPLGSLYDIPNDTVGVSVIAAIIISCVAGLCVILLGILFVIMKRRQKRFNYGQRCTPVSLDAYSLDSVSIHNSVRRKGIRTSKRSYGNAAFDDPEIPSHSMNFAGLANFSSDKEQLYEEFSIIPQVSPKTDELPAGAERKNRYANVIPLPETRVYLSVKDGDNLSDYINANYVRGLKGAEKLYIACQAPMESTVEDFWRMIWEQQSKVVIMLTNLQENGMEKCTDYLPPNEVTDNLRLFGDYQITLKKRDVKEKYVISHLKLKNMDTNLWREVTHLWYLGWPDQGVPSEGNSLIAFLIEARSQMKSQTGSTVPGPVVVHCSPGTGRTGTVIACDLCIREYEQTRMVDIPKCVFNLRKDRAGSVQTKDQYAFIYQVLNLYATKLTGGGLESI